MQISFLAASCGNLAALSCGNITALSCGHIAAHCLRLQCGSLFAATMRVFVCGYIVACFFSYANYISGPSSSLLPANQWNVKCRSNVLGHVTCLRGMSMI